MKLEDSSVCVCLSAGIGLVGELTIVSIGSNPQNASVVNMGHNVLVVAWPVMLMFVMKVGDCQLH